MEGQQQKKSGERNKEGEGSAYFLVSIGRDIPVTPYSMGEIRQEPATEPVMMVGRTDTYASIEGGNNSSIN